MKAEKPSCHNNLGLSYFERGDFENALIHYQKAISLEESAIHYSNRGLALYHINRLDEAKKDFDRAIELDPENPTIIFNRGNVFLNCEPRNFEKAHEDYNRALEVDPTNPKYYHAKGLAFEGQADEIKIETGLRDTAIKDLNSLAIE